MVEIDFASMKVGDKVHMGNDRWDDDLRSVMEAATEFANAQEPRWQFQAERYYWGGRDDGKGDKYNLERIK